jgi:hypothetical protein
MSRVWDRAELWAIMSWVSWLRVRFRPDAVRTQQERAREKLMCRHSVVSFKTRQPLGVSVETLWWNQPRFKGVNTAKQNTGTV